MKTLLASVLALGLMGGAATAANAQVGLSVHLGGHHHWHHWRHDHWRARWHHHRGWGWRHHHRHW
ncbi:MAG TPA: hypothetical protein VGB91_08815 [Rhizomicrobium sp.]